MEEKSKICCTMVRVRLVVHMRGRSSARPGMASIQSKSLLRESNVTQIDSFNIAMSVEVPVKVLVFGMQNMFISLFSFSTSI